MQGAMGLMDFLDTISVLGMMMTCSKRLALVPVLAVIGGCSVLFPTQFPSAKGSYEFSGEKKAIVIFDSDAVDFLVRPAISLAERSCEDFKSVGYIFKHSTLTRINPLATKEQLTVTRQVPVAPIQVFMTALLQTDAVIGYCDRGASARFYAQEGEVYRVFLNVQDGSCNLRVTNDRDPGKAVVTQDPGCGYEKIK